MAGAPAEGVADRRKELAGLACGGAQRRAGRGPSVPRGQAPEGTPKPGKGQIQRQADTSVCRLRLPGRFAAAAGFRQDLPEAVLQVGHQLFQFRIADPVEQTPSLGRDADLA